MDTEIFQINFSAKGYEVVSITTTLHNRWQYCKKLIEGGNILGFFFPYQSFAPHNLLKNEEFNIRHVACSFGKKFFWKKEGQGFSREISSQQEFLVFR